MNAHAHLQSVHLRLCQFRDCRLGLGRDYHCVRGCHRDQRDRQSVVRGSQDDSCPSRRLGDGWLRDAHLIGGGLPRLADDQSGPCLPRGDLRHLADDQSGGLLCLRVDLSDGRHFSFRRHHDHAIRCANGCAPRKMADPGNSGPSTCRMRRRQSASQCGGHTLQPAHTAADRSRPAHHPRPTARIAPTNIAPAISSHTAVHCNSGIIRDAVYYRKVQRGTCPQIGRFRRHRS